MYSEQTYIFSNFLTFLLELITTPHVLYDHMIYVYSLFLCLSSHDHMAKRSYYCIMIFSTSEFYSMDASPPSFPSSISSTTPLPLYSPSKSNNGGPICRRTWLGHEVWSTGRSRLYSGGLPSAHTRHCQGQMGPSIKPLSPAGCVLLLGTLTGLGKVRPPIVVTLGARGPGTSDYMLRTLGALVEWAQQFHGNNI